MREKENTKKEQKKKEKIRKKEKLVHCSREKLSCLIIEYIKQLLIIDYIKQLRIKFTLDKLFFM